MTANYKEQPPVDLNQTKPGKAGKLHVFWDRTMFLFFRKMSVLSVTPVLVDSSSKVKVQSTKNAVASTQRSITILLLLIIISLFI